LEIHVLTPLFYIPSTDTNYWSKFYLCR